MASRTVFSADQGIRDTRAAGTEQQVAIYIKNRVIVVFPNKEVDVGTMNPGDHLVVRESAGPRGRDWNAFIEMGAGPRSLCQRSPIQRAVAMATSRCCRSAYQSWSGANGGITARILETV